MKKKFSPESPREGKRRRESLPFIKVCVSGKRRRGRT